MALRLLSLSFVASLTAVALAQVTPQSTVRPTIRPSNPALTIAKPVIYEKLDPSTLTPQQRTSIDQIRKQTDQKIAKLLAQESADIKKSLTDAQSKIMGELDSLNEMSEMDSLRLQMIMDRRSKMMETLSNLLKKQSDTSQTIIQNMK